MNTFESRAAKIGRQGSFHRRFRLVCGSVFAIVVLASFTSVGYASSGANAQQGAAGLHNTVVQKTSAQGQYRSTGPVRPHVKATKVSKPATIAAVTPAAKPVATSGTLPFTGISLVGTLALGGALVGVGIALRRRGESRD